MLFNKFLGNISSKDTHSNKYGAGTASEQTFSQRKQVERSRSQIPAYQHSKIGQSFLPRDAASVKSTPRPYKKPERNVTRQEMNARPQPTFREPPTRGYNPYA